MSTSNQNNPNGINPFLESWYNRIFEELYEPLCRFCLKFTHRTEIAEDIVQEQFVYLWENRLRLTEVKAIKAYLYTAVKNKSLNFITSKYNQTKSELPVGLEENANYLIDTTPDILLENKQLTEILEKSIESLPEKCRAIFTLKRFGELSNREIAEKLNISVKTVECQMTTALKKINLFIHSSLKICILLILNYFF